MFTSDPREIGSSYDLIVLSNVLHHVRPEDRPNLILEIIARPAKHGKLVIFEHNPMNPLTRWAVSECVSDEMWFPDGARDVSQFARGRPSWIASRLCRLFPRYRLAPAVRTIPALVPVWC